MNGLAWLNELMLWFGRWFPRLVLVKPAHVGVWFGRGGRAHEVGPGVHWYWPMTSEFSIVSTRQRSSEIACQLQGREAVSVAVLYAITNPLQMLLSQHDIFSMLDDRTQALLHAAYGSNRESADIAATILDSLRLELAACGIAVHTVSVLQRGKVIPLKNLNDWAHHAKAEL